MSPENKDGKDIKDIKDIKDKENSENIFDVEVPNVLIENKNEYSLPSTSCVENNWRKVRGWYNELNFYSKVFQFFVEHIKETESQYGWWIIVISSMASFITLFTLEPFPLSESQHIYYNWGKGVSVSILTVITTLIASWVKKKGYVKRIQEIDKRVARLEKFLGLLDYQFRLVPQDQREDYMDFITKMRAEHNELAIYSNLISPTEFAHTVYIITKFHAPIIKGAWPWYNTDSKKPRENFAKNIIDTYESQYSWNAWCKKIFCCFACSNKISSNPLLEDKN